MRRWKTLLLIAGLVLCAALVSVMVARGGSSPKKHHGKAATAHVQAHHRALAASKRTGTNPDEQSTENEVSPGDSTADGVEQAPGADHQCPPACAPGEKP